MAGTSPAMTNYRLNLNSSDPSSAGTANRDAVDAQRWLADADRDALTVLAASADAVVESEIVADHRNAMQVGRPIADQHGALDRRAKLAVVDAVSLGALKDVFARCDIDLAAAEIGGVDTVLDRGDYLAGFVRSCEHVSIGHAWHRHMGKALAPAVSGRLHAHQPRILAILHIADEYAVFDQHGAITWRAFVIDRQRAAALRNGAVVDHGDAFGGDALSHQPSEGRGLLPVEIAFEAMTDGFVQHHAGPAGAEHHVHFAGGRRNGFEIDQGLAHGIVDRALPCLGSNEPIIAFAAAIAVASGLLAIAIANHDRDADAHHRPYVAIGFTVAAQDFDRLPGGRETCGHLAHARIFGARIGIDRLQEPGLVFERGAREWTVVAVELDIAARRRCSVVAGIAAFDRTHRVRSALDRGFGNIGSMRVADRFVLDRAQPEALRGVVGGLLQSPIVKSQRFRLPVFKE